MARIKYYDYVSGTWKNADIAIEDLSALQPTLISSGAAVGQIAKISAVDAAGKPTAWEPVAMPQGGGAWETIASGTAAEDITVFEFTNLAGKYDELLFCGEWAKNPAGSSGVGIEINGKMFFAGANYFVHPSQDKQVAMHIRKIGSNRVAYVGFATMLYNKNNQDTLGNVIATINGTEINSIKIYCLAADKAVLAGATYRLEGR